MTQTQVLAHLLEYGRTSAPKLACHFSETTLRAHQSCLRLERRGLVKKEKVGSRVEFDLTEEAIALSRKIKDDNKNLSSTFLLGLACRMLLVGSERKAEEDEIR